MESISVVKNRIARMMPPTSGNRKVKKTFRAESNHCLRKYQTQAKPVMA